VKQAKYSYEYSFISGFVPSTIDLLAASFEIFPFVVVLVVGICPKRHFRPYSIALAVDGDIRRLGQ